MSDTLFSHNDLEQAAQRVHSYMPPTPQYVWPQLCELAGCTVWVKHENHTPTGAFKARGGITFMDWLKKTHPNIPGIVTATRGNHGQAQALAASHFGIPTTILVPKYNSVEKNQAMRSFGGEVVEFGEDFDEARLEVSRLSQEHGLFMVPPFHVEIVRGIATYAYELFSAAPELDTVYVPIGCGSGICGTISVRNALGLKTKIVGVVSTEAQTAKLSWEQGKLVETPSAKTFADGMAVRVPVEEAFAIYSEGVERMIAVTDDEVAEAIRIYYRQTHNLAEGAGAAPLAALLQEREKMQGKSVAVILCGGNIDMSLMSEILQGKTPQA